MTPERFRKLTETYGAEPRRWPAEEREAARAFMNRRPAEAQAMLADASALDSMLDRHVVGPPTAELRERIIGSGPAARAVWHQARLWWQGAGLAGLGLAGALAGALMISVLLPLDTPDYDDDGAYVVTAFDDISYGLDE
jgi:hypothetical protein